MGILERTATIITPTYNKADLIWDAARTVFQQSYPHWKWWIVLDGPTQETQDAVRQIAAHDSRVEVFHESTSDEDRRRVYRPAAILNDYLPRITTGRACWLADDDLLEADFLEALCGALDEHPDWDAVFCGFSTYLIMRDGQVVHRYDFNDYQDRGFGADLKCWGEVFSINTLFTKRAYNALQSKRFPESWDDARMCDHLFMREFEKQFTIHGVAKILVTNRVTARSANSMSDEVNAAEQTTSGVSLKRLEEPDIEFVRQLRNANRHAFFDNREVSRDDQTRWFHRVQSDPKVAFYVIHSGGQRIGTVSLTDRGNHFELGNLLLTSEQRGKGIMEYACRMLMKPRFRYSAEVKSDNHRSRRLLEQLGIEYTVVGGQMTPSESASNSYSPNRLSIGGGVRNQLGWTTLDAHPGAKANIVATVPPLPESVTAKVWDEIELIHFLPHLPVWQAEQLLREIYGVLRPGGVLILEQPNILYAARVLLGLVKPPQGDTGQFDMWPFYGDPTRRDDGSSHRWGYHSESLRALLVKVGFTSDNIREAQAQFHVPIRDFRIEATK